MASLLSPIENDRFNVCRNIFAPLDFPKPFECWTKCISPSHQWLISITSSLNGVYLAKNQSKLTKWKSCSQMKCFDWIACVTKSHFDQSTVFFCDNLINVRHCMCDWGFAFFALMSNFHAYSTVFFIFESLNTSFDYMVLSHVIQWSLRSKSNHFYMNCPLARSFALTLCRWVCEFGNWSNMHAKYKVKIKFHSYYFYYSTWTLLVKSNKATIPTTTTTTSIAVKVFKQANQRKNCNSQLSTPMKPWVKEWYVVSVYANIRVCVLCGQSLLFSFDLDVDLRVSVWMCLKLTIVQTFTIKDLG